jgi:uncharacterized protein YjeT (DUF2065 family)
MCISLFYAQVIGLWLLIAGLAMVLHQARFKKTLLESVSDASAMNWTAFWTLGIGLVLVISHNIWVPAWPVVVTIYGWILVIQGILRLFAPEHFAKWVKRLTADNGFKIASYVWVIVGLYLVWMGFFS